MTTAHNKLTEAAELFANELTELVHATVGPHCDRFTATVIPSHGAAVIRQEPNTGIPLTLINNEQLTIAASYRCRIGASGFLRVQSSSFAVTYGPVRQGEPMFRYDYNAKLRSRSPRAHLQINDSENLAALSSMSGNGSRTSRKRAKAVIRGKQEFKSDDLHFPLGGERFRPALEDVIQFLIEQLGVEAEENWLPAIEKSRITWRTRQLGAAVADDPEAAAAALRRLGYDVVPPATGSLEPRLDHIRAL